MLRSAKELDMKHETDYATPRDILKDLPPGQYSVKEMYGVEWLDVRRKRACGRWFRLAVDDFQIPNVKFVKKRTNRSLEYEVQAGSMRPTVAPTLRVSPSTAHRRSPALSKGTEQGNNEPPWA